MAEADLERITRRGIQIFRLALAMESGDERGGGAEALFYLSDAVARVAALSTDPRLAIKVLVDLLAKIDGAWFEAHHDRREPEDDLFANIAFEVGLGPDETSKAPAGAPHAHALNFLIDAIVSLSALNSDPRKILGLVVQRLEAADVRSSSSDAVGPR